MKGEKEQSFEIRDVPMEYIDDFPDHPFQVKFDDDMKNLVESVRENGVITPVTVRQKDDGRYEMISGHRRKKACEFLGMQYIPAEIRELSRDEAVIFMVDSNLQRSVILPSEKAKSYKMKLDAMKRLPGRPSKFNLSPAGTNIRSDELLAEQVGDSRTQINRYIRLNELIPELLSMVDEGKMGMRPAVELSYLKKEEQEDLYDAMEYTDATPSHAQAIRLRFLSERKELDSSIIEDIMSEEKPNQYEKISIRYDVASRYIPESVPYSKTGEFILKALEFYCRHLEKEKALER